MSAEVAITNPSGLDIPTLIVGAGERASWRFLEFFTVNIRNRNTRAAYPRWSVRVGPRLENLMYGQETTFSAQPDRSRQAGFLGSESPGGLVFSARLAVSVPAFRVVAAARSMPGAGT